MSERRRPPLESARERETARRRAREIALRLVLGLVSLARTVLWIELELALRRALPVRASTALESALRRARRLEQRASGVFRAGAAGRGLRWTMRASRTGAARR